MDRVFLDHNATSFPSAKVLEKLSDFSAWGNPSSIHHSGRRARATLLTTRRAFAEYLSCSPAELLFTSGGTESNNLALKGLAYKLKERGQDLILTTAVEHPALLKSLDFLEAKHGFRVLRAPVSEEQGLDYDFIKEHLKDPRLGLVSVMAANNETGEIFDLQEISQELAARDPKLPKVYFHSDMVQALGKIDFDFKKLNLDLASFSSHKFYALQGSGVLYIKKGVGLEPLLHGGGQEKGRRAGTENLLSIMSLGVQVEELLAGQAPYEQIKNLRDFMEHNISKEIDGVRFVAQKRKRLPNTSLMFIEDCHGESLLMNLDLKGFEVSTGAACSSGNPEPSPVLLAMGLSPQEASKSLRVSLGWQTSKEEIELFIEALSEVVQKLRSL